MVFSLHRHKIPFPNRELNYFSLHISNSLLNLLQQLKQLPCYLLPSVAAPCSLLHCGPPASPPAASPPLPPSPPFLGGLGSASSLGLPSGGRMGKMQHQLSLQGIKDTRGRNPPFLLLPIQPPQVSFPSEIETFLCSIPILGHLHVLVSKKLCNAQNMGLSHHPTLVHHTQKWGREMDNIRCSHMIWNTVEIRGMLVRIRTWYLL